MFAVRTDGLGWRAISDAAECGPDENIQDAPPAIPAVNPRLAEIDARLTAIDLSSVRALRAAVAGTATEADRDQLAVWETEAAALRSERAGLAAVLPDA